MVELEGTAWVGHLDAMREGRAWQARETVDLGVGGDDEDDSKA
jgi:hypothetical protein